MLVFTEVFFTERLNNKNSPFTFIVGAWRSYTDSDCEGLCFISCCRSVSCSAVPDFLMARVGISSTAKTQVFMGVSSHRSDMQPRSRSPLRPPSFRACLFRGQAEVSECFPPRCPRRTATCDLLPWSPASAWTPTLVGLQGPDIATMPDVPTHKETCFGNGRLGELGSPGHQAESAVQVSVGVVLCPAELPGPQVPWGPPGLPFQKQAGRMSRGVPSHCKCSLRSAWVPRSASLFKS